MKAAIRITRITSIVIICITILYLVFPLTWLLLDVTADNMISEFAYHRVADRVVDNTELTKTEVVGNLNSWVYVNEEQNLPWMGVGDSSAIDYTCLFDLVRGIGWCDQKAFLLTKLLAIKGIEARSILFPCHTFTVVYINEEERYYDPAFNCEVILKGGRYTVKSGDYSGDCVNNYSPNLSISNMSYLSSVHNLIYRCYSKQYIDWWLELYSLRKGSNLMDIHKASSVSDYYLNEYSDAEFFPIYKARLYQLFGLYDRAEAIYKATTGRFYDEAVFYMVVLGLDTNNPDIVEKYVEIAQAEEHEGRSYFTMVESYVKRYHEVHR